MICSASWSGSYGATQSAETQVPVLRSVVYSRSSPKRDRQRYCSEGRCRKASKAASQRQWLIKSENKSYFTGARARGPRAALAPRSSRLLAAEPRSRRRCVTRSD